MKRLKTIVLAIVIAMIANVVEARSTKVHVVERGETIESIAKKYNITKDELIKQNPDVAQFVYVGMELTIPVAPVTETVATFVAESNPEVTQQNAYASTAYRETTKQSVTESEEEIEFHNWGLGYIAAFEAFDEGIYGVNYNIINDRKIGGHLFAGMNLGLVDTDYTRYFVRIGPNYSVSIAENVSFYVPFTVDLTWATHPENKKVTTTPNTNNNVNWDDKAHTYDKKESKTEFGWGLSLTPSLAIKLGGIYLNAGVALMWDEASSEVDAGIMLGIGFKL